MHLPMSALAIDDDADIAFLLKQFLEKMGYNAVSFTNPMLAFEHLQNNNQKTYSLIITDLRMPGMSGLDLANKIREHINTEIKIFLITAFDFSDLKDQSKFNPAKIERVIQKPLKFSSLKKIIIPALEQQKQLQ